MHRAIYSSTDANRRKNVLYISANRKGHAIAFVGVLLLLQTKQGINAKRHQQTGWDTCSHAVVT
jgi:hypothetical protein